MLDAFHMSFMVYVIFIPDVYFEGVPCSHLNT
jgi:hypothetical protein